jgi:hypothetical protein
VRFDPPDEAVLLDAHPLGRRRRAQHVYRPAMAGSSSPAAG